MDATDWEQRFEETLARERSLMIDLLDAARGLTGVFRPSGTDPENAARYFSEKYDAWRETADAIIELAEHRLDRR